MSRQDGASNCSRAHLLSSAGGGKNGLPEFNNVEIQHAAVDFNGSEALPDEIIEIEHDPRGKTNQSAFCAAPRDADALFASAAVPEAVDQLLTKLCSKCTKIDLFNASIDADEDHAQHELDLAVSTDEKLPLEDLEHLAGNSAVTLLRARTDCRALGELRSVPDGVSAPYYAAMHESAVQGCQRMIDLAQSVAMKWQAAVDSMQAGGADTSQPKRMRHSTSDSGSGGSGSSSSSSSSSGGGGGGGSSSSRSSSSRSSGGGGSSSSSSSSSSGGASSSSGAGGGGGSPDDDDDNDDDDDDDDDSEYELVTPSVTSVVNRLLKHSTFKEKSKLIRQVYAALDAAQVLIDARKHAKNN